MHIAHFVQRYPPALGGSEAYFARLSRYCVQRGDDVTVFTTNAVALEAFWDRRGNCVAPGLAVEDGVRVRRFDLWRCPGRRYLLAALGCWPNRRWQCLTLPCNPISPALWRTCGRETLEVDVVHTTAFPYAWPIACGLRLARRLGVPFLLTPFLHLGDPDDPRDRIRRAYLAPPLRWLLRQADGIFVQTPGERDAVLNLGIAPARIHLQGLGVDPAECTGGDRAATRWRWGIDADTCVIGHLANNSREKGTIDLLLAVARLWQQGVDMRVVLAGPEMPNFRSFWQRFARSHPQRVVRLGPLTDADRRGFFAGIDVFALPSRCDSFGLVLLEAWANGVPNVAYRAGGIADVIRPGHDGLLVPCGDVGQLATALRQMHDNGDKRWQFGAAGKQRLPFEFRWADKLAIVRDVYHRCAAQLRRLHSAARPAAKTS